MACTSNLCQWSQPRGRTTEPMPLSELQMTDDRPAAAKRMEMLQFDPRAEKDRHYDENAARASVQQLTSVEENTCLRLLWGIHPMPPEFTSEIEVAHKSSLDEQTKSLLLLTKTAADDFWTRRRDNEFWTRPLDDELVNHIDEITIKQDHCDLWHELHVGRLTSSNFGQIFHTRNSPSLLQNILCRK